MKLQLKGELFRYKMHRHGLGYDLQNNLPMSLFIFEVQNRLCRKHKLFFGCQHGQPCSSCNLFYGYKWDVSGFSALYCLSKEDEIHFCYCPPRVKQ